MKMVGLIQVIQNLSGSMVSAVIDKIGFGSVATFVGIKASEKAGVIELANSVNDPWGMPEWALLFSIIGTISFFAKNIFEMYLMWIKLKQDPE